MRNMIFVNEIWKDAQNVARIMSVEDDDTKLRLDILVVFAGDSNLLLAYLVKEESPYELKWYNIIEVRNEEDSRLTAFVDDIRKVLKLYIDEDSVRKIAYMIQNSIYNFLKR